ncbi:dihydrodipicolinate synthase family protein [Ochrobactrum quorumnocens]|uniref:Dihydrodipicolinate synthase family protein n=1 Tax=Ochrobactrum quorumnocens TaxID=271865 RepID=A0A5N1JPE0_9HYPH|nr:dihydrodipicolinate synthase family protein [[Ochrobactrum] quorumnocens]KAA9361871.1 dihydrodipicolinate synthase family protein [[Ochrobactrum] quorumnocens]MBD7992973.1 dihydrodipicolinate synthase family protein [Ochrobactrum gallinarum]
MAHDNSGQERFGLSAALTTPFDADGKIDVSRALKHARARLDSGCSSVTLFGTTGEGSSIADAERAALLDSFIAQGFAASNIVVGVMENSVADAVLQSADALRRDCKAILLAPPSYFKNLSDDGLFNWFSAVFKGLGDDARSIILYNIPSVTAVELSVDLISRLRAAFGGFITGVKDSSGTWAYTEKLLAAHKDIAILIGDERDLAAGVRLGGQGAISGMANLFPDRLLRMVNEGQDDAELVSAVQQLLNYPVTPAVKAMVARHTGDMEWRRVRAPLVSLNDADFNAIGSVFDRLHMAKAA